jgi:aldose 1-epimerase
MTPAPFGTLPSGEPIHAWTLENAAGSSLRVITLGAIVTTLRIPDRNGRFDDVVLGFNSLDEYLSSHPYFGAICGRIAGRVTDGQITVEGVNHQLSKNDGRNHAHGGVTGLDRRIWRASPIQRPDGAHSLRLSYHSPHGEEGYPGNLDIAVIYTLTADNRFVIETEASSDRPTPLSLTQHSYFNLAGEGSGSVVDHELQVNADMIVPTDEQMTLSGRSSSVLGRPNDFTRPRRLRDSLPLLFKSHGDLYLLGNRGYRAVARLTEPRSGRVLEVSTDEPCLQLYSGVALDSTLVGKSGKSYEPHAGFCLECEGYPDGTFHPEFGDILVRPDRPQRRRTTYAFSTS